MPSCRAYVFSKLQAPERERERERERAYRRTQSERESESRKMEEATETRGKSDGGSGGSEPEPTADNTEAAAVPAAGATSNGTAPAPRAERLPPPSPPPAEGSDLVVQQATYRQLPDEDVNWLVRKMVKQNGNAEADVDDGAQERMLKDELKLSVVPSKDASEVQFRSENGDAKIDIETVKQSLSGMGKAELMKYANDPFWIKLRWFLFIAFWLLWAAMLAGAIAIIVMAPKCAPPPPKKWWEESPIVRLRTSDTLTKSLNGLEPFLNTLKEQHVRAISLGSILKETSPGLVVDFKDVNQQVGSMEDFKKFVRAAADRKQNIILEIDPNHSSNEHPWFLKSVQKEEPYTSYYVWADGRKDPNSRTLLPPNNWISLNGGSAWKFNDERKQYYLHQFNDSQPDFNYTNPAVIAEFSNILKHWLNLGVKGFVLSNTRYLVEDPSLSNDSISATYPAESGSYSSLLHIQTRDHHQNAFVLRQWRDIVTNYTGGEGLFTLSDGIGHDILQLYNKQKILIDLPQSLGTLSKIDPTFTANQLNDSISEVLAFSQWPGLDLNGKGSSLRKRMKGELADNLILMAMLLPATPILNINDTTSAKGPFATLAEARKNLAFQYGETQTHVLNNGTVFVYTRIKSGNPGYLVAFNTASYNTTIDVTGIPHLSEEVNVVTHSQNYNEKLNDNKKLTSKSIPLSSKSTLVVTFVPM